MAEIVWSGEESNRAATIHRLLVALFGKDGSDRTIHRLSVGKDPHEVRPSPLGRFSSLRHPIREAEEPRWQRSLRPGVAAENL
jgi:hypothetical protein